MNMAEFAQMKELIERVRQLEARVAVLEGRKPLSLPQKDKVA